MPDEAGYWALRHEVGGVWLARDFVRVGGPDAATYLQGQLSQDVEGLAPAGCTWSWLLAPTGKVDALVRLGRLDEHTFVLDTDRGFGGRVIARLERFKLRTKVDVEALDGWRCLTVRGPAWASAAAKGELLHAFDWPGLPGFDVLGDGVTAPGDLTIGAPGAWEAVRVEAGIPAMGAELTEATIPAEAGGWLVERTVSFTKGCYTGQELVARVDSRGGHVPRHLRGVVVAAAVVPPPGAMVRTAEGREVGALTSVAESAARGAPVALAYVQRAVEPPADVTVAWEGGEVVARVEALPLVQ